MSFFDTLRLTAKRDQYGQLPEAGDRGPYHHLNERVGIKDRSHHRNREANDGAGKVLAQLGIYLPATKSATTRISSPTSNGFAK